LPVQSVLRDREYIAKIATHLAVIAFVMFSTAAHKDQAFQASSPKTSRARPKRRAFFCLVTTDKKADQATRSSRP
jgi:hypothetical protein